MGFNDPEFTCRMIKLGPIPERPDQLIKTVTVGFCTCTHQQVIHDFKRAYCRIRSIVYKSSAMMLSDFTLPVLPCRKGRQGHQLPGTVLRRHDSKDTGSEVPWLVLAVLALYMDWSAFFINSLQVSPSSGKKLIPILTSISILIPMRINCCLM